MKLPLHARMGFNRLNCTSGFAGAHTCEQVYALLTIGRPYLLHAGLVDAMSSKVNRLYLWHRL